MKKNNFEYYELEIDVSNMEMLGSSELYNVSTQKYSRIWQ